VSDRARPGTLAQRLDRLFKTMHPLHRGEYSTQEVVDGIAAQGGPRMSTVYLWQLRKGRRDNPTKEHLEALASFFGVSPSYFFEDDVSEIEDQLEVLALYRDQQVRYIAERAAATAAALPESRRNDVLELLEILRRASESAPSPSRGEEPTET